LNSTLSVLQGCLCIIAGLLVLDFCTSLVRAYSVMPFDRGGQAALVTHGRMFTMLLSLANRLILVKSRFVVLLPIYTNSKALTLPL
ncbi:hypothetical protein BDY19DRAFT_976225, partial [Irpex rosettiformis]